MFMGKADLVNIRNLLKIRNKESTGINYIYYLLTFLFVMDLIGLIRSVFAFDTEAVSVSFQPYSNWSFVLMIFACLYYTVTYNDYNNRHQIYPQNNKSRFLSYLLFCYLSFLKTQAAALGLYFLQLGICGMFDSFKRNIDYAYPFSPFFLISGICVTLLYGFIILSLMVLLGALDRKFNWWFRLSFIGIMVILVTTQGGSLLIRVIHFLTKEYSLPVFIMKALIIWLGFLLLGYIVNVITRYYRLQKNFKYYYAIIAALLLLLIFIKGGLTISPYQTSYGSSKVVPDFVESVLENAQYQVDVSSLPDGAQLKVKMSWEDRAKNNPVSLDIQSKSPDKLLINYAPPANAVNDIDFNKFTKPILILSLDNNILSIRTESMVNRKIVMLYPFSFLQNFDCYKESYYKLKSGTSSTSGSGAIYIFPPKGKNIEVNCIP